MDEIKNEISEDVFKEYFGFHFELKNRVFYVLNKPSTEYPEGVVFITVIRKGGQPELLQIGEGHKNYNEILEEYGKQMKLWLNLDDKFKPKDESMEGENNGNQN